MLGSFELKTGSLLISEPFMMDPNFKRSVILMVNHLPNEASFGLVLNQTTPLELHDVLRDLPQIHVPLFFGGPVEQATLHFIHNTTGKIEGSHEILDGLYYGGDFGMMINLINAGEIEEQEVKFFMGYAGWSPGQLETEIKGNTWIVTNDYNAQIPLMVDAEDLWKESLIAMGPKFAHVANFPENPLLN